MILLDSGFAILLLIPVAVGVIAIIFYFLAAILGFVRDSLRNVF